MTAPVGTPSFTTPESKSSEGHFQEVILKVLSEPEFCDFSIAENYSVNELYGSTIATNKDGKDALTLPDSGVLKYKNKVVGLGDNKYQHTYKNACERVALYVLDAQVFGLSSKRVFIVFCGDGFKPHNELGHIASTTGKMVVRAQHHCTTLINPTEQELIDKYREYLRNIIKEEA